MSAWEAMLAFWLSLPPSAPYRSPPPAWADLRRLVTRQDTHVGLAWHTDGNGAVITLQVRWR